MSAIATKTSWVTSTISLWATKFTRASAFFVVVATTFVLAPQSAFAEDGREASVHVVERAGPWVAAVVAIPRGQVPRAHVAGIAAWLSAASGQTQGAVSLVRSRGAQVSAVSVAGGLVIRVEGPRADTRLLIGAALSILQAFSPSPGTFAAAKRSLQLSATATSTLDVPAVASRAAWQTWFNQPAPNRAPSAEAIALLSELEVRAAWRALDRSHAALFVEVDPRLWTPGQRAPVRGALSEVKPAVASRPVGSPAAAEARATAAKKAAVLALVDPAFRRLLTAPTHRAASLPRPNNSQAPMAEDAKLPFVLTQPLPLSVAHDEVQREFLSRELSASLKAAVWVEAAPDAALLFVWPNGPTTPRALRAALAKWGKGLRWSRAHARILGQIDNERAVRWTRVGDLSVHRAVTWLADAPAYRALDSGVAPKAARSIDLPRVVEDLPLLVWPETMRAFAVKN